jgi:hypothetical protein
LLVLINNLFDGMKEKGALRANDWFTFILGGVLLFVSLNWLSCFTSISPGMSFYQFRHELGPYLGVFLVILSEGTRIKEWNRLVKTIYLAGIAVAALSIVLNLAFYPAPQEIKEAMIEAEIVRYYGGEGTIPVRAQYPFSHHNRLGFYLMCAALMVFIMRALFTENTKFRNLIGLSLIVPLAGMILTFTRGAAIAIIPAVLIVVVGPRWKNALWVGLLILFVLLFSPSSVRRHYLSIFQEETYTDKNSTVKTRFIAWSIAGRIIQDYPGLGIGYGWRNFEYLDNQYRRVGEREYPHCHNTWLEVVCEAGPPAGVVFVVTWLSLIIFMLKMVYSPNLVKEDKTIALGFIGLFVGVGLYMFSNYVLRYTLGMHVWILLALSLTWLLYTQDRTTKEQ